MTHSSSHESTTYPRGALRGCITPTIFRADRRVEPAGRGYARPSRPAAARS